MKQHILPKQAAEITEDQFYSLFPDELVKRDDWANYHHKKVTIGKMIEFLSLDGDLEITQFPESWFVSQCYLSADHEELVDALWEIIKCSFIVSQFNLA
jgi:hypothetical protein